jgi:hypothetical protein
MSESSQTNTSTISREDDELDAPMLTVRTGEEMTGENKIGHCDAQHRCLKKSSVKKGNGDLLSTS